MPDFKNQVSSLVWWSPRASRQLADTLANELSNSGGVTVVERQNLKAVLSEQELAELGIVRSDVAAAQRGQVTGAQCITSVAQRLRRGGRSEAIGGGMRFLGSGGSKTVSEAKTYASMDLRVVDASTAKQKEPGGSLLPLAALVGD